MKVLELVSQSDCSASNCEFIALAEQSDTPLITMDKKLLQAFPKREIPLKWASACAALGVLISALRLRRSALPD